MATLNLKLSIGSIIGTANNLTIRQGEKFTLTVVGETKPLDWFGNMDPVLIMEPNPTNDKEATFTAANPGKSFVQIQEKVPFHSGTAEEAPRVKMIAPFWVTVLSPEAVAAQVTERGTEQLDAEHGGADRTG